MVLRHGVGELVVAGWLPAEETVAEREWSGIWLGLGLGAALVCGKTLGGVRDVVCGRRAGRVVGRGASGGLAVVATDAGTGRTSR